MNSSLGKHFKNSITGIRCKNVQFKGRNKTRQKHGLVYIFITQYNNQCCSSTVEDSSCPSAWHQYFITTSYKPSVILIFSVHSSYKDRPHDITPIGMFFFSWKKNQLVLHCRCSAFSSSKSFFWVAAWEHHLSAKQAGCWTCVASLLLSSGYLPEGSIKLYSQTTQCYSWMCGHEILLAKCCTYPYL